MARRHPHCRKVEFAYASLATGRLTGHAAEWLELRQAVKGDDPYDAEGFDRRVDSLRQQYRKRVVAVPV